jgi:hypothetical protein
MTTSKLYLILCFSSIGFPLPLILWIIDDISRVYRIRSCSFRLVGSCLATSPSFSQWEQWRRSYSCTSSFQEITKEGVKQKNNAREICVMLCVCVCVCVCVWKGTASETVVVALVVARHIIAKSHNLLNDPQLNSKLIIYSSDQVSDYSFRSLISQQNVDLSHSHSHSHSL